MKDQFVTFEIAKKLKELGFNEPCLAAFDGAALYVNNEVFPHKKEPTIRQKTFGYTNDGTYQSCAAPLWQQAIDWLRDKQDLIVIVDPNYFNDGDSWNYKFMVTKFGSGIWEGDGFKYYSEAREAATIKALELIK